MRTPLFPAMNVHPITRILFVMVAFQATCVAGPIGEAGKVAGRIFRGAEQIGAGGAARAGGAAAHSYGRMPENEKSSGLGKGLIVIIVASLGFLIVKGVKAIGGTVAKAPSHPPALSTNGSVSRPALPISTRPNPPPLPGALPTGPPPLPPQ